MNTGCYNGGNDKLIQEAEQLISHIERGSAVLKFYPRKRPERRSLYVRRETHQIIWYRNGAAARLSCESYIDIHNIKEVRVGKAAKDFERWPDESKRLDGSKCFTIYFGIEFKLRSASFAVTDEEECEAWVKGVTFLMTESQNASYPLLIERWLRKEFYSISNTQKKVTLKEVKAFLPRVNCKISTSKLRDLFQELDSAKRGELGFDDFAVLYHKIMFDQNNVHDVFDKYSLYCTNGTTITAASFRMFLRDEQRDPLAMDEQQAADFIRNYLQDPQRDIFEPYFTLSEFIEMLFSKQNSIWDSRNDRVTQDMSRPLSHYWISSSHNTYLTGDQFSSESSLESYVRCLRAGCRCIELDCWDGPEGVPFIYHGHTLTTKIRFLDVLRIIKENAFVASEYPLILSIEDNCTLPQQRRMASAFQDIFGDMLLTHPVDKNETQLPSPKDLRRKIILKHKKLPEGADENAVSVSFEDGKDLDLRNSIKNGILYLEDPVDKEWNAHVFVLTDNKLYYTENYKTRDSDSEGDAESDNGTVLAPEELHFGECWFHGKLVGNRKEAEDLLRAHSHLGEGTFLVRESVTFVGDYCLSFWRNGMVNHCRIKVQQDRGQTKYCLIKSVCFDSLYSLITHYRTHTLRSQNFETLLTEPVPQPKKHESKEWYHRNCSRAQAEELLRKSCASTAFLVRPSEREPGCYAISFRTGREIKHCRIQMEGRLYTIGTVKFESLVELVSYYEKHPLYKKVKLRYPISENQVRALIAEPDDSSVYGTPGYMDPTSLSSKSTVEALYDYAARQPDELSFCKHAIISNVTKEHKDWWRGDYGGKRAKWFPANHVRELQQNLLDEAAGGVQRGVIELFDATVELVVGEGAGVQQWVLRIHSNGGALDVAATSRELAFDWLAAIKETAQNASARSQHNRKMERTWRIAKEISNLIVYCRSVAFSNERIRTNTLVYNEMSSFPETKAERIMCQQETAFFLKYHRTQLSRVYPKGQRIDSSNYNPIPYWNYGSQMIALNYQTPDKPMQLNVARFRQNGGCGYVLKPEFMFDDSYHPADKRTAERLTRKLTIRLRVIGARHLTKTGRGTASPFVEVEMFGAEYDAGVKLVTKTVSDNGFNPIWNDICEFEVANPEIALIRFVVQDEDMFGDPNFIGQATYPLMCLRTGFRSVILQNGHSEDLGLSSLLVHLAVQVHRR